MWSKLNWQSIPDQVAKMHTAAKFGLGVLGVYATYLGARGMYTMYRKMANGKIRRQKTRENADSIKELERRLERDPLPAHMVANITALSLGELVEQLKQGKIRPIEALKAYQTKALEAHAATNCLVEAITEAEEWALQLERGPRDGLLWGVPLSIKDDVGIKGYDSCIGLVCKIGHPSPDDGEMLKLLRREGAIPFVKTNVPQTELSFEPGNPINGTVHNPYKRGYGPGGSSSGEAALIASGGSILGIGSDIGGSIRVPAHFCGIFGFKPTSERISTRGMSLDDVAAGLSIRGVWGPLAKDVTGIVTMMKALWTKDTMANADPECLPIPFNVEEFSSTRKLRIGYYIHNGITPTFSACVRATEMAKHILSDLGHELVHWEPPEPEYTFELGERVLNCDGGKGLKLELYYDVGHPTIDLWTSTIFKPRWLKRCLSYVLKPICPEWSHTLYQTCGARDVFENGVLTHELWQQRRVIGDSWNAAGLDAVICPPQAMVAPPHGNSELLLKTMLFTYMYNILHFPAGVVPMTHVVEADVARLDADFPQGGSKDNAIRQAMSETVGLPAGVMVASARYHDETCLRVMQLIADNLKNTPK